MINESSKGEEGGNSSIIVIQSNCYPEYTGQEVRKMSEKAYEAIELAAKTGKIKKGTNEVTKMIEKGKAKLVVVAQDISPKEIVMHIPMLCKEKKIPYVEVLSKEELGAAAGMPVGTSAVAITEEGEAKEAIESLAKSE